MIPLSKPSPPSHLGLQTPIGETKQILHISLLQNNRAIFIHYHHKSKGKRVKLPQFRRNCCSNNDTPTMTESGTHTQAKNKS